MVTRCAVSVGLLVLSLGPLFAQGKDGAPGNPPVVLIASEIDPNGALELVQYKTIFLHPASPNSGGGPIYNERSLRKVSLEGVKICGGDGKEVTVETARKLLGGKETPILASSQGQQLPPFYRKVFKDEVLLFAFPQESPTWKTIEEPDVPVRK
jgi:hypothetical protein